MAVEMPMIWATEALCVCEDGEYIVVGQLQKRRRMTEEEYWHFRQDSAERARMKEMEEAL